MSVVQSHTRLASAIIERWLAGETVDELAEDYGLSERTVCLVVGAPRFTTRGLRLRVRKRLSEEWGFPLETI